MADCLEISTALAMWARAVDRRRWGLLALVFHEDATDDHGSFRGTVRELADWLRGRHGSIVQSTHFLSPPLIEFAGPDRALSETQCLGYQIYEPAAVPAMAERFGLRLDGDGAGAFELHARCRYVDLFERRQDRKWRIARRVTVADHVEARPALPSGTAGSARGAVGSRDGSDPLWLIRAEAGLDAAPPEY